jgi:hypothetical protein
MHNQAELRHSQLIQVLHDKYGQLRITGLRHIGAEMDATVYRADSPELGPVAIKMPHARWVSSGNEPRLDTRTLLRQELQLSQYLQAHGLPVPDPTGSGMSTISTSSSAAPPGPQAHGIGSGACSPRSKSAR